MFDPNADKSPFNEIPPVIIALAVIVGGISNASWWMLLVGSALIFFWVGDLRLIRRRDKTE